MTNLDESPVIKEININKNHIDNFILDTKEGTKRVKEKFHIILIILSLIQRKVLKE